MSNFQYTHRSGCILRVQVKMEKGPSANPICFVCLKAILRREPRYRRGPASLHVECEKAKKGQALSYRRSPTAPR